MLPGILTLVALFATTFVPLRVDSQESIPIPDYWKDGQPSGLPLPSSLPLDDYEEQLYAFLFERQYTKLKWGGGP